MLNDFNCSCPIYIACGYTDLRRGIDGLASIVQSQFQLDPFQKMLLSCSAAEDKTASRDCTGKETDFSCCINDWRTERSSGRETKTRCGS